MEDNELYEHIKAIRYSRRNPIKIASKKKKPVKKVNLPMEVMFAGMTEDKKADMIKMMEESL